MSDDRKIIHMKSRLPYEAPPAPPAEDDLSMPDPGCEAVLEGVGALVASGQMRGLVVLGWDAELGRFERFIALPADKDASNAALHFAGGLEILRESLMDIGIVEGGYGDLIDEGEDFEE